MNPRKFQRLARKGRTTKYLRRKIMRDLGAHDACLVSVLRGWTWDVGRKSRWPVPLDMYIAQRERQIHEKHMRRMRYRGAPLPLRTITITVRMSDGETITYEEPLGAVGEWVAVRVRHTGAK